MLNGTYADEVLLDARDELGTVTVTVVNCLGEELREEGYDLACGLHRLAVPPAGHILLRRFLHFPVPY